MNYCLLWAPLSRGYIANADAYYFLARSLNLVMKSNPLKHLLYRPTMLRHIAQWLLQLSEFDFVVVTPRSLAYKLRLICYSSFIFESVSGFYKILPCEEICFIDNKEWCFFFHGSSTQRGGEVGYHFMLLLALMFIYFLKSGPLSQQWSLGWSSDHTFGFSLQMGSSRLYVQRDSTYIIKQVNGEFSLKEITLVAHRTVVISKYDHFQVSNSTMCHRCMTSKLMH